MPTGEIVNRRELSRLTGLSLHNIDLAVARGAPHTKSATKQGGYKFNTAEFLE